MRTSKTHFVLAAIMAFVPTSAETLSANVPVGLEAVERLDLISVPRPGVRTYQYSSHDPSGGNSDSGNYLYEDGDEHVLLDVKGPGCICRFWFTGPTNGRVRLYFDGSPTPLFDMDRQVFFSGVQAPFLSPLVGDNLDSSGGYYCYLPMMFAQACKITTTGDDHYYNITFQRFADAENITTFDGTADSSAARTIWSNAGQDPKPDHGDTLITDTVTLPPLTTITLADIESPGIIQQIEITIPDLVPGDASRTILSGLWLDAFWDNAAQAAVSVPIGDFFGSGLGLTPVRGLPVGMDSNRLYCYLPMPFANAALLRLTNNSETTVANLSYNVRYTSMTSPPQGMGAFHARFLSETPTTTGRDYLVLEETGAGHFIGVVQTLTGYGADRWHLEGDERIHVDGALTPSLYGTGTEDFYNGGWYFAHGAFTLPVHGCPRRNYPPEAPPYLDTCYRFFLSDTIPFAHSIRVGIEHGPANDVNPDSKSVAFYYKVPYSMAELTDEFDPGNAVSENAHDYMATGITWTGLRSESYEGDNDHVSINDHGIHVSSGSAFTVAIGPHANGGVLLRRRMDYGQKHQQALVYVDNVPAGTWYEPGQNSVHRWRDSEFMIPPALTQNKDAISVRIENISADSDWTEYKYWIYTLASPAIMTTAPADFDRDGDVDQADFGHLQTCFTGEGVAQNELRCRDARLDMDNDVDVNDFSVFQMCVSGANVPADPSCGK